MSIQIEESFEIAVPVESMIRPSKAS